MRYLLLILLIIANNILYADSSNSTMQSPATPDNSGTMNPTNNAYNPTVTNNTTGPRNTPGMTQSHPANLPQPLAVPTPVPGPDNQAYQNAGTQKVPTVQDQSQQPGATPPMPTPNNTIPQIPARVGQ